MSTKRIVSRVSELILAIAAAPSIALAQCYDWKPGFHLPGIDGNSQVKSLAVFDDGGGPELYVGGIFNSAGGVAANGIVEWNGAAWSPLGSGVGGLVPPPVSNQVAALCVFDDGTGPALYAGGAFTTAGGVSASAIARWNGSTWSSLGSGMAQSNPKFLPFVEALTVFDDGSGPALYAGGSFTSAGGVPASSIAKWNGSSWSPLGSGVGGGSVSALAVFDDGTGPALYAGGSFNLAGGNSANHVAKWDGSSWAPLGIGTQSWVGALCVYDDGNGPALFAGGQFFFAGGVPAENIARWDGQAWTEPGGGLPGNVYSLTVFDDGSGPELHAGGDLSTINAPGNGIVRWNGSTWSPLGSGTDSAVYGMTVFDDGGGPALWTGGGFLFAGDTDVRRIARWRASAWSAVGGGQGMNDPYEGLDPDVQALTVHDGGGGPALYAGGSFTTAGGVHAERIAMWDGTSWAALGPGLNAHVSALTTFDDGTGADLYAGGTFTGSGGVSLDRIARWRNSNWEPVGGGFPSGVNVLGVFDGGSGPDLIAGGSFTTAGGVPANSIAKWNGSAWAPLGGGLTGPFTSHDGPIVSALAVFDDGSGPKLYAAGHFEYAGAVLANCVARWNGSTWSALGSGLNAVGGRTIHALAVFDDGTGPALYAGGVFPTAGGVTAKGIARWNGSNWSALGNGTGSADMTVSSLVVFDDGSGPALYAGGNFSSLGGVAVKQVARWNGSTWSAVGSGIEDDRVHTLAVFDDGSDGIPDLYAGGRFALAGGIGSRNIAQWRACVGQGIEVCPGDGSAAACPCGNSGMPGRGCQNSASTGGASLFATGTTNPDTVVLRAANELPHALTIFLQGSITLAPGVVFGDGLRCAGGMLKRMYVKSASGGSVSAPGPGDLAIRARSAALGDTIPAGHRRYYQTYYRDSNQAFCPSQNVYGFNASNGVRIIW